MKIKGIGKVTWTIDGEKLVIRTSGDVKYIPLASLRTCEFKPKTFLTNNKITITTDQKDTEEISISESIIAEGKKFYEMLMNILTNRAVSSQASQPSAADEMLKLKALLDSGAIDKVEFDAMKKKLLGL